MHAAATTPERHPKAFEVFRSSEVVRPRHCGSPSLPQLLLDSTPSIPESDSYVPSVMPFTTEAYVLEKVNSDFKLETVELDDPQDEEVLVEGGIC